MNIRQSLIQAGIVLATTSFQTHAAFPNMATLEFNPGVIDCLIGGVYPNCTYAVIDVTSGSYFAMDTNGNGEFHGGEKTVISQNDGLSINNGAQPALGSHGGGPDGSETPGIDNPWLFFSNTGMHLTDSAITVDSDDGNGNVGFDFTGWGITWNNIPLISLEGDSANYPSSDDGVAIMSCYSTEAAYQLDPMVKADCVEGSFYVLDYTAHVKAGDPSGFGGVGYLLHLEGLVAAQQDSFSLAINIPTNSVQECSDTNGSNIDLNAAIQVPIDDSLESIVWSVDGDQVGEGESITAHIGLGDHFITTVATTTNGLVAQRNATMTIEDTTQPEIDAAFVIAATDEVITQVEKRRRIAIRALANDVCDPNPIVTSANIRKNDSVSVEHGDKFRARRKGKTNILKFEETLWLNVSATDASGNASNSSNIKLIITE